MFLETSYNDCNFDDGLGALGALPADYVQAGSEVFFSANVLNRSEFNRKWTLLPSAVSQWNGAAERALSDIRNAGYRILTQSYNADAGSFMVTVRVPVDMGAINHIRNAFVSALDGAGLTVRQSGSAAQVRFTLDLKSNLQPGQPGGPPLTVDRRAGAPGTTSPPVATDWLDSLRASLGLDTTSLALAGIGLAVALVLLMRR